MTKIDFVELVHKNDEFGSKVDSERADNTFISSVREVLVKKTETDNTYTKAAHTVRETLKDIVAGAKK